MKALRPSLLGLAALALSSCGTLAPDGGGDVGLPLSGVGPFRKLAPSDDTAIAEPVVLAAPGANLDDPFALVDGERLTLWFSRSDGKSGSTIGRADLPRLEDGAPSLDFALAAESPWEMGGVAQPSVLRGESGGPWLLFYAAGGAIGYATGDGVSWDRLPGPALAPGVGERALGSPAPILEGDRVRLYFVVDGGAVEVAEAALADLAARAPTPFVRVAEDPVVRAGDAPWLEAIGRVTARAVATSTGRTRYDLYLSGTDDAGQRAVGMAASWDGESYAVPPVAFLDARRPNEWSPTVVDFRGGALLLFTQPSGAGSVVAAATSP